MKSPRLLTDGGVLLKQGVVGHEGHGEHDEHGRDDEDCDGSGRGLLPSTAAAAAVGVGDSASREPLLSFPDGGGQFPAEKGVAGEEETRQKGVEDHVQVDPHADVELLVPHVPERAQPL